MLNGNEPLTSLPVKGTSRINELIIPRSNGEEGESVVDVDASAMLFDNTKENDTDNKEVTVSVINKIMRVITN